MYSWWLYLIFLYIIRANALPNITLSVQQLFGSSIGEDENCTFTDGPSPQKFVAEGGSTYLYAAFSVCPSAIGVDVYAFSRYLNEIMEPHRDVQSKFNGSSDNGLGVTVDVIDIRQSVVVYILISFNDSSSNKRVKIHSNMSYIYVQDQVSNMHHFFTSKNNFTLCYDQPPPLPLGATYYFIVSLHEAESDALIGDRKNVTDTCVDFFVLAPDLIRYIVTVVAAHGTNNTGGLVNLTIEFPSRPQFNESLINIRECNENDVCIQLQANLSENCLNCTPSALGFEAECALRDYKMTTFTFTHVDGYIEFGGAEQMTQYKIERHQFCSLEYGASNIAGNAVYSMNISTYNTQTVNIDHFGDDITCFECVAIANNSALGCKFKFGDLLNDTFSTLSLYYDNAESVEECDHYYLIGVNHTSVTVHDINEYNETIDEPAWSKSTVFFPLEEISPSSSEGTSTVTSPTQESPNSNGAINVGLIAGIVIPIVVVIIIIGIAICIFIIWYKSHRKAEGKCSLSPSTSNDNIIKSGDRSLEEIASDN